MTDPEERGEPLVRCPVDGCTAEQVSRGLHLHVLRSVGSGHGEQGDIPPGTDLDDAEVVGHKEVDVDYPDERKTETAARLCPYCERPFKGRNGVLIHLGLVGGRKDHPANASEVHESTDFPVVEIDENENVVAVVSRGTAEGGNHTSARSEDSGDTPAFVSFTKDQVDYLTETSYAAGLDDGRLLRMIRQQYIEKMNK